MQQQNYCKWCFLWGSSQGYLSSEIKKGNPVQYNWATLFLGDINMGDQALQVGGVSRIWIIKYGLESSGTQTREGLHWRGSAATVNYRTVLSSERALQNNKPTTV
jgi:hypothetical protein